MSAQKVSHPWENALRTRLIVNILSKVVTTGRGLSTTGRGLSTTGRGLSTPKVVYPGLSTPMVVYPGLSTP